MVNRGVETHQSSVKNDQIHPPRTVSRSPAWIDRGVRSLEVVKETGEPPAASSMSGRSRKQSRYYDESSTFRKQRRGPKMRFSNVKRGASGRGSKSLPMVVLISASSNNSLHRDLTLRFPQPPPSLRGKPGAKPQQHPEPGMCRWSGPAGSGTIDTGWPRMARNHARAEEIRITTTQTMRIAVSEASR